MQLALPLLVLLMQPPETAPEPATDAAADPRSDAEIEADFVAAWERLLAARKNKDVTRASVAELEQAIEEFASYEAQLVDEAKFSGAAEDLRFARLVLARSYYFVLDPPDPARGEQILDQVLRAADPNGSSILQNVESTKVDLVPIAKKRLAKIEAEGKGQIHVVCHKSCFVSVDHRPFPVMEGELTVDVYLGVHEVTVLPVEVEDSEQPVMLDVQLAGPGEVADVIFGQLSGDFECPCPGEDPCPCTADGPCTCPAVEFVCPCPGEDPCPCTGDGPCTCTTVNPEPVKPQPPPPKRMLPRWAEITGIGVGVGLIGMGAGLATANNKCTDPYGPADENCPELWKSGPGTGIGLGLGAALAITSTVLLVIDERRVRKGKAPTQARIRLLPSGVLRF